MQGSENTRRQQDIDDEHDNFEMLVKAISKGDCNEAVQILESEPLLLTNLRRHHYVGECNCSYHSERKYSPIEWLICDYNPKKMCPQLEWHYDGYINSNFSGSVDRDSPEFVNRVPMMIELFEKQLLKPDDFSDTLLFDFVEDHDSSGYQFSILDTFVQYLPKDKWIYLKTFDGCTILHAVISSHMVENMKCYYFKLFMDMGVDPRVFAGGFDDYSPGPGSVITDLIRSAEAECLRYVLTKFKLKPRDFNEPYNGEYSYYNGQNYMMACLSGCIALTKRHKLMMEVRETFEICVANGLDLEYKNLNGEDICDYIVYYGWLPILGDLVKISENAGRNIKERKANEEKSASKNRELSPHKGLVQVVEEALQPPPQPPWFLFEKTLEDPLTDEMLTAISSLGKFMEEKLEAHKFEKVFSEIYLLEKELLTHLRAIQVHPRIISPIRYALRRWYSCAYGFLYLPRVKEW
ncbi:MAG: hypothetical protein Satyrvirus41_1, partial [Satyrvirus sp.]